MRALLGVALAAAVWISPVATVAGEGMMPADEPDDTLVFGLTATQLALTAAVGAGAGAAAALASGNVIAGASLGLGTLAAIYVAHWAVEAVLVGGIYYWWPWQAEPESLAARTGTIRGATGDRDAFSITPLGLSPRR